MNIAFIDYSLATNSLDIYVSGCNGNCVGCHNPELFDFNIGEKYTKDLFEEKIKSKVLSFGDLVNNIMIFGGDPLDQESKELINLLSDLKSLKVPVWLFTRYNYDDISSEIKEYCDYIKTGRYKQDQISSDNVQFGMVLASKNQKIYKLLDKPILIC